MRNKRYETPKYFNGTKQIEVPNVMGQQELNTAGITGASAGYGMSQDLAKTVGAVNPVAGAAVGVVGTALGAAYGYSQAKGLQREQRYQRDKALDINAAYEEQGIGNTQQDLNLQPYQAKYGYNYKDGSASTPAKEIEIEKGEIVTDGDYNIKTIGETPHSQGGDDIVVNQGDVVFPTQNPKDFSSIMEKIKAYKNGFGEAKAELDKEKDKLPTDTNKAQDGFNNPYQVNPYMESVPRGYTTGDAGELPNVYGSALSDFASMYKGQGTPEQYNSFLSERGVSPRGMWQYQKDQGGDVGTAISDNPIGPMSTADANRYYSPSTPTPSMPQRTARELKQFENVDESSFKPLFESQYEQAPTETASATPTATSDLTPDSAGSLVNSDIQRRIDPTKYANIAYNLSKSYEPVDTFRPQKPTYQRYQYEDMSAPARRAALDAMKIGQRNIEATGGSRGQIQSYLGQEGARYAKNVESIQAQEAARKMNIAAQNVALENRARDMEYQDRLRAREYEQRGEGVRQDFESQVAKEVAQRGDISEQREYMIDRNVRQYERDKVYLDSLSGRHYKIDPSTGRTVYINK